MGKAVNLMKGSGGGKSVKNIENGAVSTGNGKAKTAGGNPSPNDKTVNSF